MNEVEKLTVTGRRTDNQTVADCGNAPDRISVVGCLHGCADVLIVIDVLEGDSDG